jgi:hypothetical protein
MFQYFSNVHFGNAREGKLTSWQEWEIPYSPPFKFLM